MNVNIGGLNYASSNSSKAPYIDAYNAYLKDQQEVRNAYMQQIDNEEKTKVDSTNKQYDSSAKNAYLQYMQNQRKLPTDLNALGVTGGAAESSLIRLGTNYGSNLADNENNRNSNIASLNQTYASNKAQYDEDFNTKLAQAKMTALENQKKWEDEQRAKDLQYFASSISGRYTSSSGYQALINELANSNDPNKSYKIALAQQAMNNLTSSYSSGGGSYSSGGGSYSSGGGSYSSGSGSSGGGGGSSSSSSSKYNAKKVAQAKARSQKTYGTTSKWKMFYR